MADAEVEKFRSLIGTGGPTLGEQPAAATDAAAPNAGTEISRFRSLIGDTTNQNLPPMTVTARPALTPVERFGRRDTTTGQLIPFDVKRGLGDDVRARANYWEVAMQSGPEAKLDILKKLYPNQPSRMLPNGDIMLEINDSETGQKKEVLVNPAEGGLLNSGIGPEDLMDLAAQAPEIATAMAVAYATQGRGLMKTAGQIVLSALAGSYTGALRDVVTRAGEGIPVRPGEIVQRRGTEAALDMFLSTGGTIAAKALRAGSPFAREIGPGTKEFDAARGREFFKRTFGEDIEMTPAEITGSPALRAVEAMESKMPGSRTLLTKFREKGEAAITRIQRRATGQMVPEEQIGEAGIDAIMNQRIKPLEAALQETRDIATQRGEQRINRLLDEATGMVRGEQVSKTQAGTTALKQFDERLAAAEGRVNAAYAEVNKLPGGSGNVLDGTAAAEAAGEIRKELPQVLKEMEVDTGLIDELGKPITATREKEILLTSGVPEGLLKALDDLEKLRGGKVSLQTLTNMKKSAYDAIAAFKTAHGDTKDRWFTKIANAYERGIEAGVEATEDLQLKQALHTAKETYKRELLPFERPGLKEMAKSEFDTARLSPIQVVDRLFSGPKAVENFRMLKEVLGADNRAFRVIKRAWADEKLANATDPITKSIQPRELQKAIDGLEPELREELFGKNADAISNALNLQTGIKELKSMDADNVRALLALKDPTRADFEAVLRMQRNVDTAYVNSLLSDVAEGQPIASKLKPTEFVKKLLNTSTPTKDVERVLQTVAFESPETRQAIANHTFYQLLDAASYREADTAGKLIAGEPLRLSSIKLADALGRPGTASRNRYELLLGNDKLPQGATRLEVLENLVKTLGPREGRDSAFGAAGGLAQGGQIQLSLANPLQYAANYAKKAAYAAIYLNPKIAKLVTNQKLGGPQTAAIANTVIASEPFLRRLVEVTGDAITADEIVDNLKQSIDRYIDEWKESPEGREFGATARFLEGGQQPMQVEAGR